MKLSYSAGLLAALAGVSNAFPAEIFEKIKADPNLAARAAEIESNPEIAEEAVADIEKRRGASGADAAHKIFEPVPIFNAKRQFIDVTKGGPNPWKAPGPKDLRGPCPGLNAFANHGFLPHSGYATISEFIDATMHVVGMGPGLASFLAVLGATIDGDGTAWSIGGTPLGGPQMGNGISASHNKYESDASPMRPDLYEYGNDYKVRIEQFQQLSDLNPSAESNYGIDTLTLFRKKRFDTQKANNPYFFNGPFTGVLVQPAAYTFIYRFMANHSEENPEGLLNRHVLQSWFSITGKSGSYKWTPGYERIPENWYRRPHLYPYDQGYFIADVANAAKIYPEFLDIGGNTGKPNTFTGIDLANFTGGIINGKNLFEGNNFACLAYEFAAQAKPDVPVSFDKLTSIIEGLNTKLTCPQLEKFDKRQLEQFPGYRKSDPVN